VAVELYIGGRVELLEAIKAAHERGDHGAAEHFPPLVSLRCLNALINHVLLINGLFKS